MLNWGTTIIKWRPHHFRLNSAIHLPLVTFLEMAIKNISEAWKCKKTVIFYLLISENSIIIAKSNDPLKE